MASLDDSASLVIMPSGVKDGKEYSIKPTDGSGDFTFSRGTDTATRVNSSGLIEKERSNQLLQSNQFDTTWIDISTNKTSGQSGYDGSNDAWLLSKTNASARLYQNITYSGVNTFSLYVKAGTLNWVMLNNGTNSVWYDLQNGEVGENTAGGGSLDASIESVGSGWYRVILVSSVSASLIRIYPAEGDNDVSGTSGNIYIQDAMLNAGLVATDYIETTTAAVYEGITDNLPRLDYSGGASCPSLLLEPSRTNYVPNSEHFAASTWGVTATLTPNAGISPEGVQNAYNIAANSGLGNGITDVINIPTSGVDYTSTIYYKSAGATTGSWRLFDGSTGASTTITLEPTSEWKRAEITRTAGGSTTQLRIDLFNNDGDLLIYGAELEAGSYPTSYIPTYGTSASRASDSNQILNTSLANITSGTMYLEVDGREIADAGCRFQLATISGETSNRVFISYKNDGKARVYVIKNGSLQADRVSTTAVTSGIVKIAARIEENNIKLYLNGTEVGADSVCQVPSGMNKITIGRVSDGNITTKDSIKQVLLFPTALTDAELAALTTI